MRGCGVNRRRRCERPNRPHWQNLGNTALPTSDARLACPMPHLSTVLAPASRPIGGPSLVGHAEMPLASVFFFGFCLGFLCFSLDADETR